MDQDEPDSPADFRNSSTLLVRRTDPTAIADLAGVASWPDMGRLSRLAAGHSVYVLSDVTLPPATPPLALMVLDLQSPVRRAQFVVLEVAPTLRRRGLGRRVFEGTAMLLRAEGYERVDAAVMPGDAAAMFLTAVGFVVAEPRHLVYWL